MFVQRHHIYYAYFWPITQNLLQTMLEHRFSNTCIFLITHLTAFLLLGTLDNTLACCLQWHFKQWNHQQRAQTFKKCHIKDIIRKTFLYNLRAGARRQKEYHDAQAQMGGRCPSRNWGFSPQFLPQFSHCQRYWFQCYAEGLRGSEAQLCQLFANL